MSSQVLLFSFIFRCITCRKVPPDVTEQLCSTIEHHFRIPWKSGAIRLRPDIVFPLVFVPCSILVASLGPVWTVTATFVSLFVFYRAWRRHRHGWRRTPIFFVFSITFIATMSYTFVTIVVAHGKLFIWEMLLICALVVAMVYHLIRARRDPGIVHPDSSLSGPTRRRLYSGSEDHVNLPEFEVVWVDSRPIKSRFCIYLLVLRLLTVLYGMQMRSRCDENSVCLSVCPSVKCVICHKTKETCARILIRYERLFS